MSTNALVHFRCTAPAHRRTVQGRVADTLTIHERQWAFCPFDASGPGHTWQATGGVPIESLRQGSPRISISLDARSQIGPADRTRPDPRTRTAVLRERPAQRTKRRG